MGLHDDLFQASGKQTDLIIMGFPKAFDCVPHQRLLYKLSWYGIRGNCHRWIQGFLTGRTLRVVLDGERSDVEAVTSGVPEGSVLGPNLFCLFINDIAQNINSRVHLFSDHTIIYQKINNANDSQ